MVVRWCGVACRVVSVVWCCGLSVVVCWIVIVVMLVVCLLCLLCGETNRGSKKKSISVIVHEVPHRGFISVTVFYNSKEYIGIKFGLKICATSRL